MLLDEKGKACPLPVVAAKNALNACPAGEVVEVLVDNEIAVQNLTKMAKHKKLSVTSQQLGSNEYAVKITAAGADTTKTVPVKDISLKTQLTAKGAQIRPGMVVVLSSKTMGIGDAALGTLLMEGFTFALSQQDILPETVLLFNGGVFLACEGADSVKDLQSLAAEGVEILACGTCLQHYNLQEKLTVGSVTNMYEIVEKLTQATHIVKP